MLTVWGRRNSSNVRKVIWCLEELQVPYRSIDAGGAFGVVNEPDYRALNPNGRVPTLKDGELVLWESNAIVRYLCAHYAAGTPWFPADAAERASADKWMDWCTSSLAGPFKPLFWGLLRTPAEQRNQAEIQTALAQCAEQLSLVDQTLARQPWLSGQYLGMGDIPLGAFAYAWFGLPIERPSLPHLHAWYERLQSREAYRKGVMTVLD